MTTISSFAHLSDEQLLNEVKICTRNERHATVKLIASLAEFDARRLYLGEGCSSLFAYCTQVLHLSEHAAYGRIEAARAARRFPLMLDLLTEGALTLTAICTLAPHLTPENHHDVLTAARFKSKREVEILTATLKPQRDVPTTIRRLPTPRSAGAQSPPLEPGMQTVLAAQAVDPDTEVALPPPSPKPPAVVSPLAAARYRVQFTVSEATHDKLRRAQDLMRHTLPTGDPAVIFDRALTLLVAELERTKFAATAQPRASQPTAPGSRHIPAAVKRQVWHRDGGRCAFVGTNGQCSERGFLEFHHVVPYADGGEAVAGNLELRCRAHNVYEAEQRFGTLFVREEVQHYESFQLGPDRVVAGLQ